MMQNGCLSPFWLTDVHRFISSKTIRRDICSIITLPNEIFSHHRNTGLSIEYASEHLIHPQQDSRFTYLLHTYHIMGRYGNESEKERHDLAFHFRLGLFDRRPKVTWYLYKSCTDDKHEWRELSRWEGFVYLVFSDRNLNVIVN